MYGLRYGTVPIVRRVGGLADTVRDAATEQGNGFVFDGADAASLQHAVARAFELYRQRAPWIGLAQRGMGEDLSWDGPAQQYLDLYAQVLQTRGGGARTQLD